MSAMGHGGERAAREEGRQSKGYRGVAMEGFIARWYTKVRSTPEQLAGNVAEARRLTQGLAAGSGVLEVAPGPGFLSIEMARDGRFPVTGVDISRTFVGIAQENARHAGVKVTFREGNASDLPFPDGSFDRIITQAAFKNFSEPQRAVDEMYRVLRSGGQAIIQDMRRDATDAAIDREVASMNLSGLRAYMTRRALRGLRGRAYTPQQFDEFARRSPFGGCTLTTDRIGQEIRLQK